MPFIYNITYLYLRKKALFQFHGVWTFLALESEGLVVGVNCQVVLRWLVLDYLFVFGAIHAYISATTIRLS